MKLNTNDNGASKMNATDPRRFGGAAEYLAAALKPIERAPSNHAAVMNGRIVWVR